MTPREYFLEVCGYELKTTFWHDFSIADKYGLDAIKDTYKRALNEWKTNHIFLTELVLVLNHKSWQHAEHNPIVGKLYADLFYKAQDYGYDNLKGEELSYFIRTLD